MTNRVNGQCLCGGVQFEFGGFEHIDEKPDYYDIAGERARLTGPEFLATLNGGDV